MIFLNIITIISLKYINIVILEYHLIKVNQLFFMIFQIVSILIDNSNILLIF